MKNNALRDRRRQVTELIRAGREMEVPLRTQVFSPVRPLPKGTMWMRFCLAMHRLDVPVLTHIFGFFIKRCLPQPCCQFVSGFKFCIGNIIADGASLFDTVFVDYADIYIGKNTGFSYHNLVITSKHDMNDMKIVQAQEIVIGENVWVASGVIILGGVHIGKNSVIGSGSVVVHDILPNCIAVGNPARPIKSVNRRV